MRELGGWKWAPAVAGAKLHFIRATRLGGDWVRKDNMSSLLMVLRLKPSVADLMRNKWDRFTKFHNERKQQTLSGGAQTEQQGEQLDDKSDEAAPKAAPKAKGKAMPKPEAKKKSKSVPKRSPRKDAEEDEGAGADLDEQVSARLAATVKDLNADCQKIKKTLQTCQSSGRTLLEQFANDEAYSWGKDNDKADRALKAALDDLISSMTSFASEYLMGSFTTLQKRYGNQFLKTELEALKTKQAVIEKVNSLASKLLKMHASSQEE